MLGQGGGRGGVDASASIYKGQIATNGNIMPFLLILVLLRRCFGTAPFAFSAVTTTGGHCYRDMVTGGGVDAGSDLLLVPATHQRGGRRALALYVEVDVTIYPQLSHIQQL